MATVQVMANILPKKWGMGKKALSLCLFSFNYFEQIKINIVALRTRLVLWKVEFFID
jgi:hypothetical protein